MENKNQTTIKKIERVLNGKEMTEEQRKTLADFDRFNDLERNASLSTRLSYLTTLNKLGKENVKSFETMSKQDLENFLSVVKGVEKESSFELRKAHVKRFFRWLHWHIQGENGQLRNFPMPKCVEWITVKHPDNNIEFAELPTEEEVKNICTFVETQRDRALIMTLWETGAEPIAVLNLKVKDVAFNQYGAVITFRPSNGKLKTEFRYREIPLRTSVRDLQLWLTMHPKLDGDESPLWYSSKRKSAIGYARLRTIFIEACEKAGIGKRVEIKPGKFVWKTYNLYKLRHQRLTEVADVLNVEELKRFAGHSRYSNVTPRYIHVNKRAIERKIYRERGAEINEERKVEPTLQVKKCVRCGHENSPVSKFCEMCSMPLDLKTAVEVQTQGELLQKGSENAIMSPEYMELMKAFTKLPPETVKRIQQEMWVKVATELVKQVT